MKNSVYFNFMCTSWSINDGKSGKNINNLFCNTHREKGTQMINSDLIQTLVIDRPNLRKNNREKIIGGGLLWRPTEAANNQIFESF